MAQVYLSFSRRDARLADAIRETLHRSGIYTVTAAESLRPAQDWQAATNREILESDLLVAVWTPESVTSAALVREAEFARRLNKLINVLVGGAQLPPILQGSPEVVFEADATTRLVARVREWLSGGARQENSYVETRPWLSPARPYPGIRTALTTPLDDFDLILRSARRDQDFGAFSPAIYPSPSIAPSHAIRPSANVAAAAGPAWLRLAGVAVGVIGLLYVVETVFGRQIGAAVAAMAKLFATPPLPSPARVAHTELVDVSVFAPPSAAPGDQLLVQVFLHGLDSDVAAPARAADPTAQQKGHATLDVALERDERLEIAVDAPGLAIEDPLQPLVWRGAPRSVQFLATIPPDRPPGLAHFRVRVMRASVPIGQVRFALRIEAGEARRGLDRVGDSTTRFRRAFLSYAHEDQTEVLKRAQALQAARIEVFQDLLSIRTGEPWQARLEDEIDRCDLFLLFWSESARHSKWVEWEVDRALERQTRSSTHRPEIMPVVLEGPPPPPPPEKFKHLHFNDIICYLIAAQPHPEPPPATSSRLAH